MEVVNIKKQKVDVEGRPSKYKSEDRYMYLMTPVYV